MMLLTFSSVGMTFVRSSSDPITRKLVLIVRVAGSRGALK